MDVKTAMKRAELFHGLQDEQLQLLVEISQERVFSTQDVVFQKGDTGDGIYIIGIGQVGVVHDTEDPDSALVYLGEGQVFGEMALIDSANRSASIIAIDDKTHLYHITTQDFTHLCQTNTAIGYIMMRNIAQDLSFKIRHRDHNTFN